MAEQQEHEQHESNEDEGALLAAAANWAEVEEDDTTTATPASESESPQNKRRPVLPINNTSTTQQQTYSLHVTQLSYDATDYDIRDLFLTKGCLVTSVRLVYSERDPSTLIRKFKGVAFVDVADQASYDLATQLHRTYHLGRRINVRPTLSRDELTRIAEATKEKVNTIIQAATGNTVTPSSDSQQQQPSRTFTTKKPDKNKPKPKNKTSSSPSSHDKDRRISRRTSNPRKAHRARDGEDVKLTKKERNRKAAILLARRRTGRK